MLSYVLQNWPFDDRGVGLFDTNEQMVTTTRLNKKVFGFVTFEKGRHTAKQVST